MQRQLEPGGRDLAFAHRALGPPARHGLYRLRRRGRLAPCAHQRELRVAARALGRGLGLAGLAVGQLGVAETVEPGAELAGADLGLGALAARGGRAPPRRPRRGRRRRAGARPGAPAARAPGSRPAALRAAPGRRGRHAVEPGLELAHAEPEPALLLAQRAALLGQRLEPALLRGGLGLLALEPDAGADRARPGPGARPAAARSAACRSCRWRSPPPSAGRAARAPSRTRRQADGRRWGSRPPVPPSRCAAAGP